VLEASPLRGQTIKMPRIRKVIGDNMVKALQEQAQLSSVVEVDVTRLMKLRGRAKDSFAAREGVKLSPMPFFVKAAAQALKAHAPINAKINEAEGTITYFDTENVGIAVDSEKGLMTPVIKNAGDLNLAGIAKATAELAGKVRANKITPDELSGATFTISNTGSRGALFDTIIVPPGQVAILGIGAVHQAVRHGQAPRRHRDGGGHGHRRPRHDVPDPVLRPPPGGRRRRGPLPDGGQGHPGGRRVRGRARPLTVLHG
jgi:2-oxoglutarate dehydrogenase E2 component (dihydrolipoamide succinyltransferase)